MAQVCSTPDFRAPSVLTFPFQTTAFGFARQALSSLLSDPSEWLTEDIQKRMIIPLNARRSRPRTPKILRKLDHLRLSLPSVTPPPAPPPEYMFSGDVDGPSDIDMEHNPYHYWLGKDGARSRRRKSTSAVLGEHKAIAVTALISFLVLLGLVLILVQRGAFLELVARLA